MYALFVYCHEQLWSSVMCSCVGTFSFCCCLCLKNVPKGVIKKLIVNKAKVVGTTGVYGPSTCYLISASGSRVHALTGGPGSMIN